MDGKNSGLPSSGLCSAGTRGPTLDSYPARIGVWLSAAPENQPGSPDNDLLTKRDSKALVSRNKSWKSCSTHVYLSHLIKALQTAKRQDQPPVQLAYLTPNEGLKQSIISPANDPNMVHLDQKGAGIVSAQKRLFQDQQQASSASFNKQCLDFLSLSSQGGGGEAAYGSNCNNKLGNGMDSLSQLQIPYLQSVMQNQSVLPVPPGLNHFSSSVDNDFRPPQGKQVQAQARSLGSPLLGPPYLGTLAKQKQQWQQMWMPPPAAQYRPNWQNGRHESSLAQFAQSKLPPLHSSLEVLGAQFQQRGASSPLPVAWALRQHHLLPSGYERDGVGSRPDTLTITLQ